MTFRERVLIEFGYVCAEKGLNLEATFARFAKIEEQHRAESEIRAELPKIEQEAKQAARDKMISDTQLRASGGM